MTPRHPMYPTTKLNASASARAGLNGLRYKRMYLFLYLCWRRDSNPHSRLVLRHLCLFTSALEPSDVLTDYRDATIIRHLPNPMGRLCQFVHTSMYSGYT